jgi:regulator of nonsense transcripts 2
VGICKDDLSQNEGFVPTMLNTLFSKDKTQHANMSLACSFLKYYSPFFILTDKEIDSIPTLGKILDTSELLPRNIQLLVTKIMTNYYETVKKHLVFEHERLKTMESTNEDIAISRGDLTDDRKEMFERRKKFYEKIRHACLILSEKLYLDMPELPEETNETLMTIGISTGKNVKEEKV